MFAKKTLLPLLVIALLTACDNNSAPSADFRTLDKQTGNYADFQGRWLFINYWAEWCKPCIEEIPELNHFDKQNDDVTVIGIHYDRPAAERQRQLAQKLGIEFTVILGKPASHFGYELPNVLPTTAVINPQGKLVTLLKGPQDRQSLQKAMASE